LITNNYIYTYDLKGNTNTSFVSNSSQVNVNQGSSNLNDVMNLIEGLKKEIDKHQIEAATKEDLIDCVVTIQELINARSPTGKFLPKQIKDLSAASNVATIASLGLQIYQNLSTPAK
jgi:hypothetical protein